MKYYKLIKEAIIIILLWSILVFCTFAVGMSPSSVNGGYLAIILLMLWFSLSVYYGFKKSNVVIVMSLISVTISLCFVLISGTEFLKSILSTEAGFLCSIYFVSPPGVISEIFEFLGFRGDTITIVSLILFLFVMYFGFRFGKRLQEKVQKHKIKN